jgi:CRISPR type III-associated protein (TIGR04423 family)
MKTITDFNNLCEEIPKLDYKGYFWMSDSKTPVPVDGEFAPNLSGRNPFIIEANLYSEKGSISISIEHIDGKYLINTVNWKDIDESIELEETDYVTHGLQGNPKARFVRAWVPAQDPECEKIEVLQPAWRAFKGFINQI